MKEKICPIDGHPCDRFCSHRYKNRPEGGCFLTDFAETCQRYLLILIISPFVERKTMENNKICPLLSITSEDNLTDCYGESCAWYVPPVYASNGKLITKGRCAIHGLGALPELVREVARL